MLEGKSEGVRHATEAPPGSSGVVADGCLRRLRAGHYCRALGGIRRLWRALEREIEVDSQQKSSVHLRGMKRRYSTGS